MIIDQQLLDTVSAQAAASPRLRMNCDLRTTPADTSQRMLNAIEPGTVLPVHRHMDSSETCVVIRGRAEEIFYDDNGAETERVLMVAGGECIGVNIARGRWHRIVSLEPGTVILEAKDCAYQPVTPENVLNI